MTFTRRQSQESSSATSMGRQVCTPWPISECPHQIVIAPEVEISSQALGVKEACEAGTIAASPPERGKWNPKTMAPPAVAEFFRNERRVSLGATSPAPGLFRRNARSAVSSQHRDADS